MKIDRFCSDNLKNVLYFVIKILYNWNSIEYVNIKSIDLLYKSNPSRLDNVSISSRCSLRPKTNLLLYRLHTGQSGLRNGRFYLNQKLVQNMEWHVSKNLIRLPKINSSVWLWIIRRFYSILFCYTYTIFTCNSLNWELSVDLEKSSPI